MTDRRTALLEAHTEAEILEALAQLTRKKARREPETPTIEALAAFLPEAPEKARTQADKRLGTVGRALLPQAPLEAPPAWIAIGPHLEARLQFLIPWWGSVRPLFPSSVSLETVHILWVEVKKAGRVHPPVRHPLAPILRAWWKRPPLVERNPRRDPLFPAPVIHVRPEDPQGQLFSPQVGVKPHPRGQLDLLPRHGPGRASGPIEPAPLLAIYDAGGGPSDSRVGSMAGRIWLEGVLDVAPPDRGKGPVRLPPITTRELLARLYPDHPGRKTPVKWRPDRQLDNLLQALDVVDGIRVPILDGDGRGTFWRIVSVVGRPGHRLDDALHLVVDMPPGSERGPIVDRLAVRMAGARSATAWRLALSLAFRWHDPGRLRLPVGGGRTWRQTRTSARYPDIGDAELLALAFPTGDMPGRPRNARAAAEKALDYLVEIGYAAIERPRRIMPGPTWAGWGEAGDGGGRA